MESRLCAPCISFKNWKPSSSFQRVPWPYVILFFKICSFVRQNQLYPLWILSQQRHYCMVALNVPLMCLYSMAASLYDEIVLWRVKWTFPCSYPPHVLQFAFARSPVCNSFNDLFWITTQRDMRLVNCKDIFFVASEQTLLGFLKVRCTFPNDPCRARWIRPHITIDCRARFSRQIQARFARDRRDLDGAAGSCVKAHLDHPSSDASSSLEVPHCSVYSSSWPRRM